MAVAPRRCALSMAGSAYEIYKLFNFQDASRGGRYHSEEQAVRSYSIHSRLTSRRLLEGADGRTHSAAREYRTDDAIRPPHLLRAAQHAIVCAKENHEARHRNAHKLAKSSHGAQGTDIAGHMAELVIPKVHRPQRTHDGATYSAVGHTRVTWRLLDRTSRHPQELMLVGPCAIVGSQVKSSQVRERRRRADEDDDGCVDCRVQKRLANERERERAGLANINVT